MFWWRSRVVHAQQVPSLNLAEKQGAPLSLTENSKCKDANQNAMFCRTWKYLWKLWILFSDVNFKRQKRMSGIVNFVFSGELTLSGRSNTHPLLMFSYIPPQQTLWKKHANLKISPLEDKKRAKKNSVFSLAANKITCISINWAMYGEQGAFWLP